MYGFTDGADVDIDGTVWAGVSWVGEGRDGVHAFAPDDDALIGAILLPEVCANCAFGGESTTGGGEKHNRLFMTASHSVYALYVNTHGAHAGGA